MEKIILVDGTWDGLLSAVFDVFAYKLVPVAVEHSATYQAALFAATHEVATTADKVSRVQQALKKKIGARAYAELYYVYLSELPDAALLVVRTASFYFRVPSEQVANLAVDEVLRVRQLARIVSRERHRMNAFVRFKLLSDGLYVALIEPDYNVLPVIASHFEKRYADQRWLIYDVKRSYGIYYDLSSVTEITFESSAQPNTQTVSLSLAESEDAYDELWRRYFKSVNILERKNTKLHLQHVPKRYWKYLNEKRGI